MNARNLKDPAVPEKPRTMEMKPWQLVQALAKERERLDTLKGYAGIVARKGIIKISALYGNDFWTASLKSVLV